MPAVPELSASPDFAQIHPLLDGKTITFGSYRKVIKEKLKPYVFKMMQPPDRGEYMDADKLFKLAADALGIPQDHDAARTMFNRQV